MSVEEDTSPHPALGGSEVEPVVLGARYVLAELLGQGGMADVYRARDSVLNRDVAVKVFRHRVEIPDAALRRTGEVHLLAGLSHPNLVMLFDASRDDADSYDYLVMELVPGTTLTARIPLPAADVARLGAQLAGALAYVHDLGIVHRDVKPANVLLDPAATTAKLTDFGVARLVEAAALTEHGTTLGTPNYLSPEQATGEPVTGAGDVYSLGLVLFEALTGEKAFPGSGIETAIARLHRDPWLPDRIDVRWHRLIAAMTARAAASRPTAAQVAATLHSWDAVGDATLLLPARPRRRSRTWLAAGIGVALAAAAVTVAVVAGGSSTGQAPPAVPQSPVASVAQHVAAPPSTPPSSRSVSRSKTEPSSRPVSVSRSRSVSRSAAPVLAGSSPAKASSPARTTPAAVVRPPAGPVHVPPGQAKKLSAGPKPGGGPGRGPGRHKP